MTVMDAALRESLKALRLSGMLETLDARLAQAHGGELGHLDFLQVLCQGEITRRETVAFQRRLPRAKFGQQVTLEEFDFTASSKLPAAQIRDLGALRWLHAGESVILFGPVGVGKTHIAQALGHLAVRQGAHVRFAKTSSILAELARGHADRIWEKRIRELVCPDVLILDDFAMRQLAAAQADDLYEFVSERQGRRGFRGRGRAGRGGAARRSRSAGPCAGPGGVQEGAGLVEERVEVRGEVSVFRIPGFTRPHDRGQPAGSDTGLPPVTSPAARCLLRRVGPCPLAGLTVRYWRSGRAVSESGQHPRGAHGLGLVDRVDCKVHAPCQASSRITGASHWR
ncbi:hypothetical protein GCM10010339_80170 [Streptomyces alanosinicus]|uniref:AAA+ ATPase domain-containing protein n=1 Tax=Streptomyces alanosinicus TaxID=68171 RepID=A0A918YQV0_9ACTN|nr:ATP-binding protein [Streptomyces alanosinicus]GHE13381.1 hypothetical protein GCM10010339_80170 [Streptomyces alanosinicus]